MYHLSPPVCSRADSNLALQQLPQFKETPWPDWLGCFFELHKALPVLGAGLEHHLQAVVFLVTENVVAVDCLTQGQRVRDDVVKAHIAVSNVLEQPVDVLVGGGLTAAQSDTFIEELTYRKVIERCRVHAKHRYVAAAAHGAHAGQQYFGGAFFEVDDRFDAVKEVAVRLKADSFYTYIGP